MHPHQNVADVVDVHVTSQTDRVDAFSQYDLLDGQRKYTVELTEFVSPLAGHGALPSISFIGSLAAKIASKTTI